jgi:hypothetical protein
MPTDYFARVVLVLRNGATALGTAGVFVDKFVCIEQNDFARLDRSDPIKAVRNTQPGPAAGRKRSRLNAAYLIPKCKKPRRLEPAGLSSNGTGRLARPRPSSAADDGNSQQERDQQRTERSFAHDIT